MIFWKTLIGLAASVTLILRMFKADTWKELSDSVLWWLMFCLVLIG